MVALYDSCKRSLGHCVLLLESVVEFVPRIFVLTSPSEKCCNTLAPCSVTFLWMLVWFLFLLSPKLHMTFQFLLLPGLLLVWCTNQLALHESQYQFCSLAAREREQCILRCPLWSWLYPSQTLPYRSSVNALSPRQLKTAIKCCSSSFKQINIQGYVWILDCIVYTYCNIVVIWTVLYIHNLKIIFFSYEYTLSQVSKPDSPLL